MLVNVIMSNDAFTDNSVLFDRCSKIATRSHGGIYKVKEDIQRMMSENTRANGDILSGLRLACCIPRERNSLKRNVVLISDGRSGNAAEIEKLIGEEKNRGETYFFSIGVGTNTCTRVLEKSGSDGHTILTGLEDSLMWICLENMLVFTEFATYNIEHVCLNVSENPVAGYFKNGVLDVGNEVVQVPSSRLLAKTRTTHGIVLYLVFGGRVPQEVSVRFAESTYVCRSENFRRWKDLDAIEAVTDEFLCVVDMEFLESIAALCEGCGGCTSVRAIHEPGSRSCCNETVTKERVCAIL